MITKIKIFFLVMLLGLCAQQFAAGITVPADNFYPGWKKSSSTRFFKKADLFNHINGAAEMFLEFGFEDLHVQRYKRDKEEISLEIYRMENPAASLGIYLFKCGKETHEPGISARNSVDPYQFTIVKGSYFLQVNNPSGNKQSLPVMKSLAIRVLKEIPPDKTVKLFGLLPTRDLLPGSERILRGPFSLQKIFFFGEGDILQLRGKIFAVTGDYRDASNSTHTLILIPYPDPKAANSAYRNIISKLDPYLQILSRKEKEFIFKDYQNKYGVVHVKGPLMLMRIKVNLPKFD